MNTNMQCVVSSFRLHEYRDKVFLVEQTECITDAYQNGWVLYSDMIYTIDNFNNQCITTPKHLWIHDRSVYAQTSIVKLVLVQQLHYTNLFDCVVILDNVESWVKSTVPLLSISCGGHHRTTNTCLWSPPVRWIDKFKIYDIVVN